MSRASKRVSPARPPVAAAATLVKMLVTAPAGKPGSLDTDLQNDRLEPGFIQFID